MQKEVFFIIKIVDILFFYNKTTDASWYNIEVEKKFHSWIIMSIIACTIIVNSITLN